MNKIKILSKQYGHYSEVHTNKKVSHQLVIDITNPNRICEDDDLGEVGLSIAKILLNHVEGINSLTLDKYKIEIFKAELFQWDEILPQAETIIRSVLTMHYDTETASEELIKEAVKILS